jgi:hypothetical protein
MSSKDATAPVEGFVHARQSSLDTYELEAELPRLARITRRTALLLVATGPLFLVGAILHPHAPDAEDMAQVAYVQTGQFVWWPAHLMLLDSYVLFALFVFNLSRLGGLPSRARRVVKYARPVAGLCVLAMLIHLLLPLGRDSVANSHEGWALWVKDVAESADAVWALCLAVVAWTLGRTRILGNRLTALLGLAGGLGFALFSLFVPLTGVVVSMQFTRSLLHGVPVFAVLIAAWTVVAGVSVLSKRD